MLKQLDTTRAALLGVLFAMVAFSYALATSTGVSEKSASAGIRAVGSLTFTNPIVKDDIGTDRYLGLAVAGSSFSRYCRATGGVPPYSFSPAVAGSDGIILQKAGLSLALSGLISGTLGTVPSPIRFGVTVTDSMIGSANTHTETFRITLATGTQFQFATGTLGDAVQGRLYVASLPVINGNQASLTYSNPDGKLAAAGLAVSNDGTLYGVPVTVGTVTFHVDCQDKNGTFAASFTGTGKGQDFSLNVVAGAVSSGLVSSSIQIKAGAGTLKDSVKLAGQINLGTNTVSSLAGKSLQLLIGPYTAPLSPAFDAKGKASAKGAKGVASTVASISSKGQLKIAVKDTITAALSQQMLVTVLLVDSTGSTVSAVAEDLPFTVKSTTKGSTYSYKSGVTVPGGSFLITSVAGKDDTSRNSPGASDAWKVAFIAQPANGQSFSASNADVTIGSYLMSIGVAVSGSKGGLKSVKQPAKTANIVTKLSMDPTKGKGSVQTSSVLSSNTNIPTGSNPGKASSGAPFFMNVTLNGAAKATTGVVYQGEGSKQIVPARNGWTSNIK